MQLTEVDEFVRNSTAWKEELAYLRSIALDCGLNEEFKWSQPCYTQKGKNIAIVSSFKKHAFISFFKGALLADTANILQAPGENSQAVRLVPITDVAQIKALEDTIKAYIFEAIEIEQQGLKTPSKKVSDFDFPEELEEKFNASPKFKEAFQALTPGRQKGYLLHFSQAKQSATRSARIEKYEDRILKGKGINDCVCGHSKRMPTCDGSHKLIT